MLNEASFQVTTTGIVGILMEAALVLTVILPTGIYSEGAVVVDEARSVWRHFHRGM
jgi:hypothetical protein